MRISVLRPPAPLDGQCFPESCPGFFVTLVPYCQVFAGRIENQLIGADGLEVRGNVDAANERIVQAMFECLQQMAKMDGGEGQAAEDKGQLNYHVIMIGECFLHLVTSNC